MNRVFLGFLMVQLFAAPAFAEEIGETVVEQKALTRHRFSAPHLGTTVHLVFYTATEREEAAGIARSAFQKIKEFDAIFSDYRADSEVRILAGKAIKQAHPVSADLFTVVACAQKISAQSGGAFDITLGKATKQWRQNRDEPGEVVSDASEPTTSYRDLKLDHERRTLSFEKPLQLDLGGIAKGYIADQIMLHFKKSGIQHAAVIIGGETVLSEAPPGKKGWRIGLENPEQEILGTLELSQTALSTSGDSYQFFEIDGTRQAHLIDPATRKGKSNRLNVTTLAASAMEADAWATALRILPLKEALELANRQPGLEAAFIPLSAEATRTTGFPELRRQ